MRGFWMAMGLLALVLVAYFWSSPRASARQESNTVRIESRQEADSDLVVAGRAVQVDKEILGDVAAAGARVALEAPVQGYVLAAGRDVLVDGAVGNDLWAAGRDVTVTAPVNDNAWLAGQSVTLAPEGSVEEDAHVAGNTVELRGRVGGNLNVSASDVRLGSDVAGSVHARAGRVQVLPGAVIRGDLTVTGPRAPEIASGAQVLGRLTHEEEDSNGRALGWLTWWGWMFVGLFVLGAFAIAVGGTRIRRVADRLRQRTGAALLSGVFGLVAIPMAGVSLAVTVIGIPLAIVVFALLAAGLALAGVIVSYRVGTMVLASRASEPSAYARLAAGTVLVTFFAALPLVGWVVQISIVVLGLGALLLAFNEWRLTVPTERSV